MRPSPCQGFPGALGNEGAFNLSAKSESECQDLAVDGSVEFISFFYAVYGDAFFDGLVDDVHDVYHFPAEPRNFSDNQCVAFLKPLEQSPQLPFILSFGPADGFRTP